MKIMLVYPPVQTKDTYSSFSFAAPILPPLGLAYMASVLLQNKFEVKIIDCVAEHLDYNGLIDEIKKYGPKIVGFNANTVTYPKVQKALPLVKELDSNIVTIIGGAHPSAMPQQVLKENKDLDIVVFGEGEYTLLEIANKLKTKKSLNKIKGTAIRHNNKIIMNKPRPLIENLDIIPFPARHLLGDLRLYSHTPLRGSGFVISVLTSRGCPFNCLYCDQSVFTRKWRANSADYVIKEIKMLKDKYDADEISFEDDNFALSKERTIEICKKMINENLNITWSCCIRIDRIDEEILTWMKKAGCKNIYVGIESGNQKQLNFINKNLSIEQIRRALKIAKKSGIKNIYGSFIVGLPHDTKETINQTINFACSLPLTGVSFNLFTPYPNTKLREIASKFGVIKENWELYSDHPNFVSYIPENMTPEELMRLQTFAYKKFFMRPKYILANIRNIANINFMKVALKAVFLFLGLSKNKHQKRPLTAITLKE